MVMQPAKKFLFVSFLLAFLCLSLPFSTLAASPLYDVEILVADESADVRWGAFVQGMREVFVRIAGDSIILDKMKQPQPTPYVKQYSYLPVESPTEDASGVMMNHRLKIQFNGSLMEKYLLDNGMPVWGEHRPNVLIWLAVRDGRNEYVLKESDRSLLKSAADEAMKRRGIPEKWPLYDRQDKKILSVADIRGGFKDPVSAASRRYTRGPALTGSLIWNGKQWQSSWSLLMKSSNKHWSLVDSNYERLIDKAVDQAADALGTVFAVHDLNSDKTLTSLQLDVDAVTTVDQYRQVEDYLSSIISVDTVVPITVDGQSVLFDLKLRSDERDFINLLKNDAELVEVKAPQQQEITPVDLPTSPDPVAIDGSTQAESEKTSVSDAQIAPVVIHHFRLGK